MPPQIPRPVAYVLAGGKSRRFGSDKARAVVHHQPFLLHVARQLAPLCESVWVVAQRAGQYEDLGLATLGDLAPGSGPLAGLQTALSHAGNNSVSSVASTAPSPASEAESPEFSESPSSGVNSASTNLSGWILLVSCDQTVIAPDWISLLVNQALQTPSARAIVFRESLPLREGQSDSPASRRLFQPFPGLYHTDLLKAVTAALQARELSLQTFLGRLESRLQSLPLPGNWPEIPQVNSPDDLAIWLRRHREDTSGTAE